MPDDRDHFGDGAFGTGRGKYTPSYRHGRAVADSIKGAFAPLNQQNISASNLASGADSPIAFLVLVGFVVFVGYAVIAGLTTNSSQKAENFMQAPEPPPRPTVYEHADFFSSIPVLVGPEGVQLRIQPDFAAKPATCTGPCPPGPMFANTTVMMNGKNDGWVHLVANYTDGWAPPGSDIRAVPAKRPEAPPEQSDADQPTSDTSQPTVESPQPLPNVRRPTSSDPQ